ncbi:MAG TPA: M48 family metallopeptidase [Terriglobales bacterium]|nr:M48 family metallopeptidase [Terriglobales bacterium]
MRRIQQAFFAILLCASPVFAQKATVPLPKPSGFNLFTVQQEIEVGRQNAAKVDQQYPVLPESNPISRYVQRLGERLAEQLPQPTYPFQFHVIAAKDINAFALPGGPVYVNLGTIQAASNEAQLAGVMAHEISHVYMRHSTKQASKEEVAQVPLGVVGAVLGGSMGGSLANLGLQMTAGSVFLKYSRDAESQADHVGAQIMYDAGYDPYQLALFFAKLDEQSGSHGSQFFSDHPNPGNRSQAIRTEIQQFPQKQFVVDTPEFDHIHQLAMNTRAYTAQEIKNHEFSNDDSGEGGYSGGRNGGRNRGADNDNDEDVPSQPRRGGTSSAGSDNYQTLDHNGFTVRYPDDWRPMGDPQSSVTIAAPNGITNNAIATGAIINNFPASSGGLEDATQQLIASLRQSNPALRTVGNDEDITVNGVHGKSQDLIGQSPLTNSNGQPQRERDWLVALPRQDGSLVYVIFISPDQDFMNLRPTFQDMLRSLHLK